MTPRWVAVCGRKGGVGKTTLALGLAARCARAGARVLVVDLDPQGSATLAAGADPSGHALAGLLAGEDGMAAPVEIGERLALLSGGPELETLDAPRPLREALAGVPADLVLVDCPPGHAELDRLALDAADAVLVCCEPHRLAVAGAARVLAEAMAREPAPSCALVLGRVDGRRGLDRAAPDLLAGAFGLPVLAVPQDAALAAALNAGTPPKAGGRAAEALDAVAAWLDAGAHVIIGLGK